MSVLTWIVIGAGIGLVLEGAGLGNPRKLAGLFVLRDGAVVQVLPTAIVASMAGLLVLAAAGFDTSRFFTPPTQYAGQIIGGLVFGVGFYLGGYCPGTSVVGLASGRLDALPFMAGMVGGWFVWDSIRGHVRGILERAPRSVDTLPEILGIHPFVLAGAFVAVGGSVIAWLSMRSRRASRRAAAV